MRMTCEGDVAEPEGLYFFYRERQAARSRVSSKSQTVDIGGEDREGSYRCRYALPTPGKWFQSPFSDSVQVKEIGDLPKPSLVLQGEDKVFREGESVFITCEAPPDEQGHKFDLYRGLDRRPVLTQKAGATSLSVTFDLQNVTRSGNDPYRCAYRRQEGEKRFSAQSDPLMINSYFGCQ
ncbi:uncharacterized protein LOC144485345 [Mustelus asterias]